MNPGSARQESLERYFESLPPLKKALAIEHKWSEHMATNKQLSYLQRRLFERSYFLVSYQLTMLEASMLLYWVEDFDNLEKRPESWSEYVVFRDWKNIRTKN